MEKSLLQNGCFATHGDRWSRKGSLVGLAEGISRELGEQSEWLLRMGSVQVMESLNHLKMKFGRQRDHG